MRQLMRLLTTLHAHLHVISEEDVARQQVGRAQERQPPSHAAMLRAQWQRQQHMGTPNASGRCSLPQLAGPLCCK